MSQEAPHRDSYDGFEGAVTGLSLADLIQLKGNNRFSGCISVEYGGRQGTIFFRDGEIIHAEKGGIAGEDAFYRIMRWPGGRFTVLPKVTTTSHTIDRGWRYLLLESHRLIDESRQAEPPKPPRKGMISRLAELPEVSEALFVDKNGLPVGEEGPAAEELAARGFLLARLGDRLGKRLGQSGTTTAVLEGRDDHLFVFTGKNHYLAVKATGRHRPSAVEESIHRAVSPRRER